LFNFPAKVPVVLEEGSNPCHHVNTTKPWDKATWHCSWSWLSCPKFIMVKEADEKERKQ
jgi:hypothetical protein